METLSPLAVEDPNHAESFRDEAHLEEIVSEAQEIVHRALASTAVKQ